MIELHRLRFYETFILTVVFLIIERITGDLYVRCMLRVVQSSTSLGPVIVGTIKNKLIRTFPMVS